MSYMSQVKYFMTLMSIIPYDMLALKDLRKENNLTQAQLAKAIGTNLRTVIRWESGQSEPSANYIIKLSKFFQISSDFILGLEDDFGSKTYEKLQNAVTPEERKILNAYRNLSPSNREMILRMLDI